MNATKFNLDRLLMPCDFPTKPEGNIKNVKITSLRLKPLNGECDITIKIPDSSKKTIHDMASNWISFGRSEIINVLVVREVNILMSFHHHNQKVNLKIKSDGTIKKDKNSLMDNQLIEEYLNYWQLIH